MNPTSRDVHIPSAMNQRKPVQKPWTVASVPPSLKNFTEAEKAKFVEIANSVLRETQDETKAIQAGLHAVNLMRLGKSWLAKNHVYKGAMVALFLPKGTAKQLAIPGGLESSELHVTLAYLGEANQITDPTALIRQVEQFATSQSPLKLKVGGVGQFNEENSEGKRPFYASVDSPDLPGFRQKLVEALKIPPDTEHGFTPHVTLKYVPKGSSINTSLPELEFTCTVLSCCLGGVRWDYPLGGTVRKARHSKAFCMVCKSRPPSRDILWNNGKARAWLCDGCFSKWAGENGNSIVRMAYIGGGVVPARHRRVRQSPKGVKKVNKDTILKIKGDMVTLGDLASAWLEKYNPNHDGSGRFAGGGGSGGGSGGGGIGAAKAKVTERATKLGYKKVSFKATKNGMLQVHAQGPKSKSPKPLNLFINGQGHVVNSSGQKAPGWE